MRGTVAIAMTLSMVARTETEFLASLRNACIKRLGGTVATHRLLCNCTTRPTFCVVCEQDFADPASIDFSPAHQDFACCDCIEAHAERANEQAIDRYYGSSTPQTDAERLSVEGRS